jgi:hypothetical protein
LAPQRTLAPAARSRGNRFRCTSSSFRQGAEGHVLFLSSEAYPLAKTDGLGDVCGALPTTLARLGVDVRVMIPGYPQALDTTIYKRPRGRRLPPDHGPDAEPGITGTALRLSPIASVRRGALPERERAGLATIIVGSRSLVRLPRKSPWTRWGPDGCRTSSVRTTGTRGWCRRCCDSAGGRRPFSLFSIWHFKDFPLDVFPSLGLPCETLRVDGIEFYGQISSLKTAIRFLIGDRGVESLLFRQHVMVRNPYSRIRLRPKRTAPGWGRTGRLLCQKRLGEVRRPMGKEAGFRENCRSLRFLSDHSRQSA